MELLEQIDRRHQAEWGIFHSFIHPKSLVMFVHKS